MIYKDQSPLGSPAHEEGPKQSTRHFLDLLPEILEKVYLHLGLLDRLHLSRVCKSTHSIWTESATLQYEFTLETSAYIDVSAFPQRRERPGLGPGDPAEHVQGVPSSSSRTLASGSTSVLSTLEKNSLLKDRERRWAELDAARQERLKVDGPAGVYELQEGVFLMCNDYSHRQDGRPTSIRLIPLPSAEDPSGTQAAPKNHKLPFSIADLTMDPTQNLIVVSEHIPHVHGSPTPTHKYHLLTLSDFTPHSLAALPILDFPPSSIGDVGELHTRQLLQVMDDILCVLVYRSPWPQAHIFGGLIGHNADQEIVCWNWKSGRVLARMQLPDDGWSSSFAILTPTSFVVTAVPRQSYTDPTSGDRVLGSPCPVIQIYTFAPDPDRQVVPVQPLDYDYMDDTTPRPTLLAQLHLPAFDPQQRGLFVQGFDMRPDPAFPARPGKPFTQDPQKGVMVFELMIAKMTGAATFESSGYELFVLRETLVGLAKAGEKRLADVRGTDDRYALWRLEETLEWGDWYEKAMMREHSMHTRSWVCSCSGYRFVSLLPYRPEEFEIEDVDAARIPYCKISILDFSPYNVRKQKNAVDHPPEITIKVHDDSHIADKGDTFKSNVWSGLPYVETIREAGVRANGVMMDDQRIIAVATKRRTPEDWHDARQEMTVFCM